MSKQLEEIFNECVDRLQQGDSIENCLLSYPDVAPELEMLLRTTRNVSWRASMVQPRPEFKAYARAQLFNAQYALAQERQPSQQRSFFSLRHAWVPALATVFFLVFSSVGTAAAAANSMPDEPLYPVKLATEQVRTSLAFSDEARAELNVKFAETRSQEIATMATQGKSAQVAIAADRLAQNIEAAEQSIRKIEGTKTRQVPPLPPAATVQPPTTTAPVPAPVPAPTAPSEKPKDATGGQQSQSQEKTTVKAIEAERLRQSLKATINKNVTVLENARDKSPEQAKPALQKAIDMAKNRQLQLQQQSTDPEIKPGTGVKPPPPPPPGPNPPKPGQGDINPQNVPAFPEPKGSQGATPGIIPPPAGTKSVPGTGDIGKPSTSTTTSPIPSTNPSTNIPSTSTGPDTSSGSIIK